MNYFLRSAFVVAAISTGAFSVAIVPDVGDSCEFGDFRTCSISLGLASGSIASTLFFLGGATNKIAKDKD